MCEVYFSNETPSVLHRWVISREDRTVWFTAFVNGIPRDSICWRYDMQMEFDANANAISEGNPYILMEEKDINFGEVDEYMLSNGKAYQDGEEVTLH